MDEIRSKLLSFQIAHVNNLVRIVEKNKSVLDASDTGTGKTYTAVAACKILKLEPIIICPKSVISAWERICNNFKLNVKFIVNYESIKFGKFYTKDHHRILCPYISVLKDNSDLKYKWLIDDPDTIFIFDEVHKCSNIDSHNGQLLYSAKLSKFPIMILSATIADYVDKFNLFFWILNFIDPEHIKKNNINYNMYMSIITKWISRDPKPMLRIHNMLYPNRASRMRIDALRGLFPDTHISAQPYNVNKKRELEIEKQYHIIAQELDKISQKVKSKKDKANILVKIMRAHQRIELIKIPIFIELANDFIENGYSVVIFVNFTQTLKLLAKMLNTKYVIYGQQTQQDRDNAIQLFNENKINKIICNIKAGGVGISLHDIYGNHPRASLISPTWNSTDLVQALGRIHRAGGKTLSLQRIIYIANTVEEKIADKLKVKLLNLNAINNGDLDISGLSTSIKFIKNI